VLRSIIFFGLRILAFSGLLSMAFGQLTPKQKSEAQKRVDMESFESVWRTVRDRHPDQKLNGLDWQAVHDAAKPKIAKAQSQEEVRGIISEMLSQLGASHYAVIPGDRYTPQKANPDEKDKPGKLVTFGNLPEQRIIFESRQLSSGAGYIRFNEFLDPVSIMPQVEAALKKFAKAPGVILDLRGNPGGIGIMAMGIAGFFVDKPGHKLGEMKMRESTLKFVIFPRPETYQGKLAILVDGGSASTTEILAQGLQDLERARIFGSRTAGAALPSDIVRLPNGDGFQYAQASYTSDKGRILEGNGVTPDVEVRQTQEATLAGRDLVIEAAETWIITSRQ
jgi:C-terminal processing protease CtpA/Prc